MRVKNIVKTNTYFDSIILMTISSQLKQIEGVKETSLVMGSEGNKEILKNIGLLSSEGEKAGPGDLIIAIGAESEKTIEQVLKKTEALLIKRSIEKQGEAFPVPKSYSSALDLLPDANMVVISVPGQYAFREAEQVLESSRSLMIFSDNVPLEEEIRLKKKARELNLLVMGPDCGTAIIGGAALGFANVVRKGPFGIVGASGTGIQEVTTLLHRKGYGISHAIGTGGRDLRKEVGGISMLQGINALENDPHTEIIILISKPPSREVETMVLDKISGLKKKYVVNFINGNPEEAKKRNIPFASGLEEAVELAISVYQGKPHIPRFFTEKEDKVLALAKKEREKSGKEKKLRGLFSGGTLAEEALVILDPVVGGIYSNIPLTEEFRLKDSFKSYNHTIVDMGEDEFTRGRPHPMIDYSLRCERIIKEAEDKECGVILFDMVIGYGAHPDPARELVPAIKKAKKKLEAENRYICFVASITGTDEDPQDFNKQKKALQEEGVIVMPSNAQAARFAGFVLSEK